MKRTLLSIATGVAVAGLATLAFAQGLRLPPDPPSMFKQPVLDLGAVNMMPDIIFSQPMGYRPLKLDLYRPKQPTGPLPVVLWLHGGAWMLGDQRGAAFAGVDMPTTLAELAQHGYVVASVQYRLSGEAKFPAQIQDVRAAVRWLKGNATTYGIDAGKVFLWGGSAGGYLAALAGVSCGDTGLEGPPAPPFPGAPLSPPIGPGSECVQGVIAFYPVIDLPQMSKAPAAFPGESPEQRFMGCAIQSCPADRLALASVLDHVDAKDPPFLIAHGDADKLVSIAQSKLLDDALKAKGVPVEFIVVPGGAHVFPIDNVSESKRKELMGRIYAFLDRNSGKAAKH